MTQVLPDFQRDGKWVKYVNVDDVLHTTVSGSAHKCMQARCVPGGDFQRKHPAYVGVQHEFPDFQDFAVWYQSLIGYGQGYHIDKDLLLPGNRVYSRDTCVLLPQAVNALLNRQVSRRGDLPIGVRVSGPRYQVQISLEGKRTYLGCAATPEEAFAIYKGARESYIQRMAAKYRKAIDPRAYEALMNYTVSITD